MFDDLTLTSTPCAIFDAKHEPIAINPAYEELIGYTTIHELWRGEQPSGAARDTVITRDGCPWRAQLTYLGFNTEEVRYLLTVTPVKPKSTIGAHLSKAFSAELANMIRGNTPFALMYIQFAGVLATTEAEETLLHSLVEKAVCQAGVQKHLHSPLGNLTYGVALPLCTFASVVRHLGSQLLKQTSGVLPALPSEMQTPAMRVDIGAALYPHSGQDLDDLMHSAEGALALAQSAPTNDFFYYSELGSA